MMLFSHSINLHQILPSSNDSLSSVLAIFLPSLHANDKKNAQDDSENKLNRLESNEGSKKKHKIGLDQSNCGHPNLALIYFDPICHCYTATRKVNNLH